MSWKDIITKDWRIAYEGKFFHPSKHSVPNELSNKVDYLLEMLELRELDAKEEELAKKVIEIYDTYVNHMGPRIDKLR